MEELTERLNVWVQAQEAFKADCSMQVAACVQAQEEMKKQANECKDQLAAYAEQQAESRQDVLNHRQQLDVNTEELAQKLDTFAQAHEEFKTDCTAQLAACMKAQEDLKTESSHHKLKFTVYGDLLEETHKEFVNLKHHLIPGSEERTQKLNTSVEASEEFTQKLSTLEGIARRNESHNGSLQQQRPVPEKSEIVTTQVEVAIEAEEEDEAERSTNKAEEQDNAEASDHKSQLSAYVEAQDETRRELLDLKQHLVASAEDHERKLNTLLGACIKAEEQLKREAHGRRAQLVACAEKQEETRKEVMLHKEHLVATAEALDELCKQVAVLSHERSKDTETSRQQKPPKELKQLVLLPDQAEDSAREESIAILNTLDTLVRHCDKQFARFQEEFVARSDLESIMKQMNPQCFKVNGDLSAISHEKQPQDCESRYATKEHVDTQVSLIHVHMAQLEGGCMPEQLVEMQAEIQEMCTSCRDILAELTQNEQSCKVNGHPMLLNGEGKDEEIVENGSQAQEGQTKAECKLQSDLVTRDDLEALRQAALLESREQRDAIREHFNKKILEMQEQLSKACKRSHDQFSDLNARIQDICAVQLTEEEDSTVHSSNCNTCRAKPEGRTKSVPDRTEIWSEHMCPRWNSMPNEVPTTIPSKIRAQALLDFDGKIASV